MKKLDFLGKRGIRFGYAIVPIVAAFLCVTFLFSCEDEPEEPNLSVSPSADVISFAADGSTTDVVEFTVTTNQDGWQVKSDRAWCVVNKTDKGFTVSAVSNPTTTAPADATITVSAGEATPVTIKAQQAAAAPTLSIMPAVTTLLFAADGTSEATTVFLVSGNVESWDVTSSQSWCTVTKESQIFSVTAAPNTTGTAPPAAVITISAEGMNPVTITATQAAAAPTLSIMPAVTTLLFAADATTTDATEFTVTTNLASWDVTSSQTWCTVTKSGNGFSVSAAPNSASTASPDATITVSAEGATSVIITASQAANGSPSITLDGPNDNHAVDLAQQGVTFSWTGINMVGEYQLVFSRSANMDNPISIPVNGTQLAVSASDLDDMLARQDITTGSAEIYWTVSAAGVTQPTDIRKLNVTVITPPTWTIAGYSSSLENWGFYAHQLIDKNLTTPWSSTPPLPQYITINFNKILKVNGIKFSHRETTDETIPIHIKVEVSDNNTDDWRLLLEEEKVPFYRGDGTQNAPIDLPATNVQYGRFLRVTIFDSTPNDQGDKCASIAEIDIF